MSTYAHKDARRRRILAAGGPRAEEFRRQQRERKRKYRLRAKQRACRERGVEAPLVVGHPADCVCFDCNTVRYSWPRNVHWTVPEVTVCRDRSIFGGRDS